MKIKAQYMSPEILYLQGSPRMRLPVAQGTKLKANHKGQAIRSRTRKAARFVALEDTDNRRIKVSPC